MKHSFYGFTNSTCKQCGRSEAEHSDTAQCECCPTIGPCELVNGMLMCASCSEKEEAARVISGSSGSTAQQSIDPKQERITALTNKFNREIPVDAHAYLV